MMYCDNCDTELDAPTIKTECPECGDELNVNINYKSPVEKTDDDEERDA